MRIACLLVPDLPLQAALRAEPELAEESLVITSGPGSRAEILTVSPRAREEGLFPGITLPQARSLSHHLVARVASVALDRAARETLLDLALSISPRAEVAPRSAGIFASEGIVFTDASGISALHDSERAFASVLQARSEKAGLPGVVAIASSRSIARLVARHLVLSSSTLQILSPEREPHYLGPLPIDLLDPDDATAETLTRFGLRRIDELLRLPKRDLAARLGPGILSLIAKASGTTREQPLPEPKTDRLEEGLDLEAPIAHLEALGFVLRGLVSRLLERLQLRSLGCAEIHLELQLENGGRARRRLGLGAPTQDERVILRLLRLALESEPPVAPVDAIILQAEGIPLRREQLDFFLPSGPHPSDLEHTLAELCALCGAERVGAPALAENHRPDGFELKPFRPRTGTPPPSRKGRRDRRHRLPLNKQEESQRSSHPLLSLRALRPPLLAEVRLRQGRPISLRSAISRGLVQEAAGPWRTTGLWWSPTGHFAVDHYDIQMEDGAILRLCFDWKAKRWQIDGLYD